MTTGLSVCDSTVTCMPNVEEKSEMYLFPRSFDYRWGGGLFIINEETSGNCHFNSTAFLLKGREMSHSCEHNFIAPSRLDGYLRGEDLHQLAN